MKKVTKKEAKEHFEAGHMIKVQNAKTMKSAKIDIRGIAKMFNVPYEAVKFNDVIKYGYNHWEKIEYFI